MSQLKAMLHHHLGSGARATADMPRRGCKRTNQHSLEDEIIDYEIDFSSCRKMGSSYRALKIRPEDRPSCSGRTDLCKEVLNDVWVSFPLWSEDPATTSESQGGCRITSIQEFFYKCEDERFELDIVIDQVASTIRILEGVQSKMSLMSETELLTFQLDDTLGGSSRVLQKKVIERIYGDKANDLLEGLKTKPHIGVPIALRRLKAKEQEWKDHKNKFNKIWKDSTEKNSQRSFNCELAVVKQNDLKDARAKVIINETEAMHDESQMLALIYGRDCLMQGNHFVYDDEETFRDINDLLDFNLNCLAEDQFNNNNNFSNNNNSNSIITGTVVATTTLASSDKNFLPSCKKALNVLAFLYPNGHDNLENPISAATTTNTNITTTTAATTNTTATTTTTNGSAVTTPIITTTPAASTTIEAATTFKSTTSEVDDDGNSLRLNNALTNSTDTTTTPSTAITPTPKAISTTTTSTTTTTTTSATTPTTSAAITSTTTPAVRDGKCELVMYQTSRWLVFVSLHHKLYTRLKKIRTVSTEDSSGRDQTEGIAPSSRKRCKVAYPSICGKDCSTLYDFALTMLRSLVGGSCEATSYEECIRRTLGKVRNDICLNYNDVSYWMVSLDKLVKNVVRELQQLTSDDVTRKCFELFEQFNDPVVCCSSLQGLSHSTYKHRVFKLLTNDYCYKITLKKNHHKAVVEMLNSVNDDTSKDEASNVIKVQTWQEYVARFFSTINPDPNLEGLASTPYLKRNIRKESPRGTTSTGTEQYAFLPYSYKLTFSSTSHSVLYRKTCHRPSSEKSKERYHHRLDKFHDYWRKWQGRNLTTTHEQIHLDWVVGCRRNQTKVIDIEEDEEPPYRSYKKYIFTGNV